MAVRQEPTFQKGWYVRPTVFADVTNEMRIAREEIFGPVLMVIPFDGVDDAVGSPTTRLRLVRLGVDGGRRRGFDIARRVRTGT